MCQVGCLSGTTEFWNLDDTFLASGHTRSSSTAITATRVRFAGTITITDHGVPEPATWAMMVLGFGAVGFALRRKRKLALISQLA